MNTLDAMTLLLVSSATGVIVGLIVVEGYSQWALRKNQREAKKFYDKYGKDKNDR
jgi:hypothetical protein